MPNCELRLEGVLTPSELDAVSGGVVRNFIGARFAYNRRNKLIKVCPSERERMRLPPPRGRVTVEDVTYLAPNNGKPILNDRTWRTLACFGGIVV
jgi:ATP-binding cassette, subfamily C, type I secretion system permease/ATPase